MAKRCVLPKICPKKQIGNDLGYGESNGHVFSVVIFEYFKTVIWAASPLPCLFPALSSLYCILFRFISSVGIELKELGGRSAAEMFEILPRD